MTNKTKKFISLVVLACFVMTQSVSANPGAGIQIATKLETPSFLQVNIPAELASLDGLYEAPPRSDPRLILQVQNAHANYGAQQKIRDLLKYLEKNYAIKTIFVEGASEDLNPDYLKMFPDKERNTKLAEFLAQQGELTGAELYLLDSDRSSANVRAHGIENAALYRENYEALKTVFGSEKTVSRYLGGFESRLDGLASKVFTPEFRKILGEWKKFEKGHREFMPFVRSLSVEARRVLGLDLESLFSQVEWPQITRLLTLQIMEKELNAQSGLAEKEDLIRSLKEKGVSGKLIDAIRNFQDQSVSVIQGQAGQRASSTQPRDLMEQLANEAGPKGFKFSDYPNFSIYAGYLILKSELDAKGLFDEIKILFTRLLDKLAQTNRQKTLLGLCRDEELVRKLLNLELSRKDWQEVLGREEQLSMDSMVSRLKDIGTAVSKESNQPLTNFETRKVNPKFRSEVVSAQDAGYKFYEAAHKREEVFYEKIDEAMTKSGDRKAVLITGGFHTDGITELLREHEVSYGILTPRLSEKSDEHLYRSVMLQNGATTFDLSYLEAASRLISLAARINQVGEKETIEGLKTLLRGIDTASELASVSKAIRLFNDSALAKSAGIQIDPKSTKDSNDRPVYHVTLPSGITVPVATTEGYLKGLNKLPASAPGEIVNNPLIKEVAGQVKVIGDAMTRAGIHNELPEPNMAKAVANLSQRTGVPAAKVVGALNESIAGNRAGDAMATALSSATTAQRSEIKENRVIRSEMRSNLTTKVATATVLAVGSLLVPSDKGSLQSEKVMAPNQEIPGMVTQNEQNPSQNHFVPYAPAQQTFVPFTPSTAPAMKTALPAFDDVWAAVQGQGILIGVTDQNGRYLKGVTKEDVKVSIGFSNSPEVTEKVQKAYDLLIQKGLLPKGTFFPILFLQNINPDVLATLGTARDRFAVAPNGKGFVVVSMEAFNEVPPDEQVNWILNKAAHEASHHVDFMTNPNMSILESEANAYAVTALIAELTGAPIEQVKAQQKVAQAFRILANNSKIVTETLKARLEDFERVNYGNIGIDGTDFVRVELSVDDKKAMFGVDVKAPAGKQIFELIYKDAPATQPTSQIQATSELFAGNPMPFSTLLPIMAASVLALMSAQIKSNRDARSESREAPQRLGLEKKIDLIASSNSANAAVIPPAVAGISPSAPYAGARVTMTPWKKRVIETRRLIRQILYENGLTRYFANADVGLLMGSIYAEKGFSASEIKNELMRIAATRAVTPFEFLWKIVKKDIWTSLPIAAVLIGVIRLILLFAPSEPSFDMPYLTLAAKGLTMAVDSFAFLFITSGLRTFMHEMGHVAVRRYFGVKEFIGDVQRDYVGVMPKRDYPHIPQQEFWVNIAGFVPGALLASLTALSGLLFYGVLSFPMILGIIWFAEELSGTLGSHGDLEKAVYHFKAARQLMTDVTSSELGPTRPLGSILASPGMHAEFRPEARSEMRAGGVLVSGKKVGFFGSLRKRWKIFWDTIKGKRDGSHVISVENGDEGVFVWQDNAKTAVIRIGTISPKTRLAGRTVKVGDFMVRDGYIGLFDSSIYPDLKVATLGIASCTGIAIHIRSSEKYAAYYGLGHIYRDWIDDKPLVDSPLLADQVKAIHERLIGEGFRGEDIEYIIDYRDNSYREGAEAAERGLESRIPGIHVQYHRRSSVAGENQVNMRVTPGGATIDGGFYEIAGREPVRYGWQLASEESASVETGEGIVRSEMREEDKNAITEWLDSIKSFDSMEQTSRAAALSESLRKFLGVRMPLIIIDPQDPDYGQAVRSFLESFVSLGAEQLRDRLNKVFQMYDKYSVLVNDLNARLDQVPAFPVASQAKITHLVLRSDGELSNPMTYGKTGPGTARNVMALNADMPSDPYGIQEVAHEAGHGWAVRSLDMSKIPKTLRDLDDADEVHANWFAAQILTLDEKKQFLDVQINGRLQWAEASNLAAPEYHFSPASEDTIAQLTAYAERYGVPKDPISKLGTATDELVKKYLRLYKKLDQTASGKPLRVENRTETRRSELRESDEIERSVKKAREERQQTVQAVQDFLKSLNLPRAAVVDYVGPHMAQSLDGLEIWLQAMLNLGWTVRIYEPDVSMEAGWREAVKEAEALPGRIEYAKPIAYQDSGKGSADAVLMLSVISDPWLHDNGAAPQILDQALNRLRAKGTPGPLITGWYSTKSAPPGEEARTNEILDLRKGELAQRGSSVDLGSHRVITLYPVQKQAGIASRAATVRSEARELFLVIPGSELDLGNRIRRVGQDMGPSKEASPAEVLQVRRNLDGIRGELEKSFKVSNAPAYLDSLASNIASSSTAFIQSIGFSNDQSDAPVQAMLVKQVMKQLIEEKMQRDESSWEMVFAEFGIGHIPQEAWTILRRFNETLRETLDAKGRSADFGKWRIKFYSFDGTPKVVEETNKLYFSAWNRGQQRELLGLKKAGSIPRITAQAHLANFFDLQSIQDAMQSMEMGGQKADIVLQRNVAYANRILGDTTANISFEMLIDWYVMNRNILGAVTRPGTLYVTESQPELGTVALTKQSQITFAAPGLRRLSALEIAPNWKNMNPYLESRRQNQEVLMPGTPGDVGTGMYFVEDPDAMKKNEDAGRGLAEFGRAVLDSQRRSESRLADTAKGTLAGEWYASLPNTIVLTDYSVSQDVDIDRQLSLDSGSLVLLDSNAWMSRDMEFYSRIKDLSSVVIEKMTGLSRYARDDYARFYPFYLALTDAVSNAFIHGNRGDASKAVVLSWKKAGDVVTFEINDEGRGPVSERLDSALVMRGFRSNGVGMQNMEPYLVKDTKGSPFSKRKVDGQTVGYYVTLKFNIHSTASRSEMRGNEPADAAALRQEFDDIVGVQLRSIEKASKSINGKRIAETLHGMSVQNFFAMDGQPISAGGKLLQTSLVEASYDGFRFFMIVLTEPNGNIASLYVRPTHIASFGFSVPQEGKFEKIYDDGELYAAIKKKLPLESRGKPDPKVMIDAALPESQRGEYKERFIESIAHKIEPVLLFSPILPFANKTFFEDSFLHHPIFRHVLRLFKGDRLNDISDAVIIELPYKNATMGGLAYEREESVFVHADKMASAPSLLEVASHELAHRAYNKLTAEQKKKLDDYFSSRKDLLDVIQKRPLYSSKTASQLVTEQVAYVIGSLAEGSHEVTVGGQPGGNILQGDIDALVDAGLLPSDLRASPARVDEMLRSIQDYLFDARTSSKPAAQAPMAVPDLLQQMLKRFGGDSRSEMRSSPALNAMEKKIASDIVDALRNTFPRIDSMKVTYGIMGLPQPGQQTADKRILVIINDVLKDHGLGESLASIFNPQRQTNDASDRALDILGRVFAQIQAAFLREPPDWQEQLRVDSASRSEMRDVDPMFGEFGGREETLRFLEPGLEKFGIDHDMIAHAIDGLWKEGGVRPGGEMHVGIEQDQARLVTELFRRFIQEHRSERKIVIAQAGLGGMPLETLQILVMLASAFEQAGEDMKNWKIHLTGYEIDKRSIARAKMITDLLQKDVADPKRLLTEQSIKSELQNDAGKEMADSPFFPVAAYLRAAGLLREKIGGIAASPVQIDFQKADFSSLSQVASARRNSEKHAVTEGEGLKADFIFERNVSYFSKNSEDPFYERRLRSGKKLGPAVAGYWLLRNLLLGLGKEGVCYIREPNEDFSGGRSELQLYNESPVFLAAGAKPVTTAELFSEELPADYPAKGPLNTGTGIQVVDHPDQMAKMTLAQYLEPALNYDPFGKPRVYSFEQPKTAAPGSAKDLQRSEMRGDYQAEVNGIDAAIEKARDWAQRLEGIQELEINIDPENFHRFFLKSYADDRNLAGLQYGVRFAEFVRYYLTDMPGLETRKLAMSVEEQSGRNVLIISVVNPDQHQAEVSEENGSLDQFAPSVADAINLLDKESVKLGLPNREISTVGQRASLPFSLFWGEKTPREFEIRLTAASNKSKLVFALWRTTQTGSRFVRSIPVDMYSDKGRTEDMRKALRDLFAAANVSRSETRSGEAVFTDAEMAFIDRVLSDREYAEMIIGRSHPIAPVTLRTTRADVDYAKDQAGIVSLVNAIGFLLKKNETPRDLIDKIANDPQALTKQEMRYLCRAANLTWKISRAFRVKDPSKSVWSNMQTHRDWRKWDELDAETKYKDFEQILWSAQFLSNKFGRSWAKAPLEKQWADLAMVLRDPVTGKALSEFIGMKYAEKYPGNVAKEADDPGASSGLTTDDLQLIRNMGGLFALVETGLFIMQEDSKTPRSLSEILDAVIHEESREMLSRLQKSAFMMSRLIQRRVSDLEPWDMSSSFDRAQDFEHIRSVAEKLKDLFETSFIADRRREARSESRIQKEPGAAAQKKIAQPIQTAGTPELLDQSQKEYEAFVKEIGRLSKNSIDLESGSVFQELLGFKNKLDLTGAIAMYRDAASRMQTSDPNRAANSDPWRLFTGEDVEGDNLGAILAAPRFDGTNGWYEAVNNRLAVVNNLILLNNKAGVTSEQRAKYLDRIITAGREALAFGWLRDYMRDAAPSQRLAVRNAIRSAYQAALQSTPQSKTIRVKTRAEVRGKYNADAFAAALRAGGFEKDVKILETNKFSDILKMGGEWKGAETVEMRVARIVGGILDLSKSDLNAATLRLHELAVAIGGDATVQLVDAFKKSNPGLTLPVSDSAGMVVDILDSMPEASDLSAKLDAIKSMLALNPNQFYGLIVPATAKPGVIRKGIVDWGMKNNISNIGERIIVKSMRSGRVATDINMMFSKANGIHAELSSFVVTGDPSALDVLSDVIRAEAKLVERGDKIRKAKGLDVACTVKAVALSQDLKTDGAIERSGKRYVFVFEKLQAVAAGIIREIQGLLSLARAA